MSSEYIFIWRIKNYSSCCLVNGDWITSPSFTVEGSEWCLKLYPEGHCRLKDSESFISLFLEWKTLSESTKVVSYSTEIIDEKARVLKCCTIVAKEFNETNTSWGRDKFFAARDLEQEMSSWAEDTLTLRCRMKIDNQPGKQLCQSLACTTIEVDRCCVEWCIEITTIYEYHEKFSFQISKLYDLNTTLNFAEEKMAILINFRDNKHQSSQRLTFTFTLFDKTGCKIGSKRASHLYKHNETWKFPDFITKEWLKCCKVNSYQYEFKLLCDVKISKKSISSCFVERLKYVSPCNLNSMRKDIPIFAMQSNFRKEFMNKTYSDVTIRCKTGDFPAHKFILRVQSPVFAAMFDQDMQENRTGVVNVLDINGDTLKAFLEFLYTGTVNEIDYEIAKKLMLAADKYQVPSLVDECAAFFKSILSIGNVCEVIAIADMIGCEHLKSFALNFIKVNASKILPTSAWTEWIEGNVKLATYILSKLSAVIGTNFKLI